MIPPPHGGRLVHRVLSPAERGRRQGEARVLPRLHPIIDSIYDAEKICVGAYSPLEGFMGRSDYESIVERSTLANGLPWPIPVILAPSSEADRNTMSALKPGDEVGLYNGADQLFAVMKLEERYKIDHHRLAQSSYGTVDTSHPNVADVFALGDEALAGPVDLVVAPGTGLPTRELTPAATREEFARRGWKNVAAYQCRNPPHTAHEYLQRVTLEREDIDGLLVHPVVGRLKKGDYRPEIILAAYEQLVSNYYPAGRVLLATLSITMRYAGPKAALFFAIVRKNFGCSHYIVGRDQAGVGTFYDPYACHRIFDSFDVGVTPLRYEETYFCQHCGWMATPKTCAHPASDRVSTSQTRIRKALADGEPLPMEIIRPEVAKVLQGSANVLT